MPLDYGVVKEGFKRLAYRALEKLSSLDPIVHLDGNRAVVVGDIHGYVETLEWAIERWRSIGGYLILLGDYVDRGWNGLETLYLALKTFVDEEDVIMLRGNHESPTMNRYYGFHDELMAKGASSLIPVINNIYLQLPYMAVLGGRLALLHGGIPCRPSTIEDIMGEIQAMEDLLEPPRGSAPFHILWNDPNGLLKGCMESPRGAYYFGRDVWLEFLEINGLEAIVRGHEVASPGFIWRGDGERMEVYGVYREEVVEGSIYTVFTSLYHGGRAGILVYRDGSISILVYR